MKINNLKVNSFGKLKDKELKLSDGINIIYGENEVGKSSMQKFISCMLYGISKNKNGKDISDFDKFKPWDTDEFSGKINYTLDNGQEFEVYREFKKKNPIIYNSAKEDISKTFKIDKTKGIDFFTEQTGIDEETFYSTAITEQEGIKLSKSSQNSIVQKISNLVSSGDDSVSFKKSLDKINRKQNEEVGTSRTSQRPLNIVEDRIHRLIQEKQNLDSYRENIYSNTERKEKLVFEQVEQENKKEFLKEVKNKLDNNRIKKAEINFNKNLEKEYNEKIKKLNSEISEAKQNEEYEEASYKNYYIVLVACIAIFILLMLINPHKIINFIFLVPVMIIVYKRYRDNNILKTNQKAKDINKEKIINEIEILNKNREAQELEVTEKEIKLEKEIENEKRELIEKYSRMLDIGYIEKKLNFTFVVFP